MVVVVVVVVLVVAAVVVVMLLLVVLSGARSKSRPPGGILPHTQCRPPGGIATRGAVRVWRLMMALVCGVRPLLVVLTGWGGMR